jgi:hypothetical protein
MTDDRLRRAYQARSSAFPKAARPTVEELARLTARAGSEEERLSLLDRVSGDHGSAQAFELLRAIAAVEHEAARSRVRRWTIALAILVTVAVVAAVLWLRS